MKRIANALTKAIVLCAVTAMALPAQTFTMLHSFDKTDGANPAAALVQATDGNFYGTTYRGGVNLGGTVFKITPGGTLTRLHSFCVQPGCSDGGFPVAGLVQDNGGDFYGAVPGGAANGAGMIFKVTPSDASQSTEMNGFQIPVYATGVTYVK